MFCEYCNTEFKTKSALNNHKNKAKYCLIIQGKIEPKEEVFKCNICEKSFGHLKSHVKIVHGNNERFQCNLCENSISSEYNLE